MKRVLSDTSSTLRIMAVYRNFLESLGSSFHLGFSEGSDLATMYFALPANRALENRAGWHVDISAILILTPIGTIYCDFMENDHNRLTKSSQD